MVRGLGGQGAAAWHPKALGSPWMGREEAPRLLRRKQNCILLITFHPAEAAARASPWPPSHVTVGIMCRGIINEAKEYLSDLFL